MNEHPHWFFAPALTLWGHEVTPAGIVACTACLLIGFALSRVIRSQPFRRALVRFGVDKNWAVILSSTLSLLLFLGSIVLGLRLGGLPVDWEARIPGTGMTILVLFRLLLLLALVFWASSHIKRFFYDRFLADSGLHRALQFTIAQIIGYLVLIGGAAIALENAGIDLSALAVFAGAVGVGLGFGLQDVARNFISGIILLIERPIEIGDRVEVGKVAGSVRQIRARSTTVVTNDNIAIIIPNHKFIGDTVTNWSHGDPKVRFRIPVSVAYGSDIEKVCTLLLGVARSHPQALADPPPKVYFIGFGDSALNFELGVWSEEMTYRPLPFKSDLNFAIEKAFRENKIEIPFPQRDVRMRNAKPESEPNATFPPDSNHGAH